MAALECKSCAGDAHILVLNDQLNVARNELKNIRGALETLKRTQQKFVTAVGQTLEHQGCDNSSVIRASSKKSLDQNLISDSDSWNCAPIGTLHSSFKNKNGTPRQPTVCQQSVAKIELNKSILTNPDHALQGLEQFSHCWVLFAFHKNNKTRCTKGKVAPPRLDGQRFGVFATRSPHRPNPIGLSLSRIVRIKANTVYLSGVDIIDKTPILDIKPYIPEYDMPPVINLIWNEHCKIHIPEGQNQGYTPKVRRDIEALSKTPTDSADDSPTEVISKHVSKIPEKVKDCTNATNESDDAVKVAAWLQAPPVETLRVIFTDRCLQQLFASFDEAKKSIQTNFCSFENREEITKMIKDILTEDPRSVYRRNHCKDQLYYFAFNNIHVTCWFDDNTAEVLKITFGKVVNTV